MNVKSLIVLGILVAYLPLLSVPALAANASTDTNSFPSSAVARLRINIGTAWVRTGDAGDWAESDSNYPLTEGSRISVPQGSEAEILFRGSQSLLLPGESEVDIRQLGEKEVSYRLLDGRASLLLPEDNFAPVLVVIPGNREIRINVPGEYSFSTNGESTRFLVSAGTGAVTGAEGSPTTVHAGEEATIGNDVRVIRAATAPAQTATQPALTGTEKKAGVPPEVAGELREYGEWVNTPEYGYAWRPYVDDGWEPYYYGRWAWISPYGWTWVGYEPWGWWPYHTGWWWPSPVFGWVWCPLHSFVSVNFVFGGFHYHGYHARFFPANVRFVGRDRFVRWIPQRPGVIESRSSSLSRDDTRLTRWNRTVDGGSVMVRRDGRLLPATGGRAAGMPRADRTGVTPSGSRGRDQGAVRVPDSGGGTVGATRPRQRNYEDRAPSMPRSGGTRFNSVGTGRISGNAGIRNAPLRSSAAPGPAVRSGGGSQSGAGDRSFRGSRGMRSRSSGRGFRSPVSGGSRGPDASIPAPSAGGFRGSFDRGSRGFGGGLR